MKPKYFPLLLILGIILTSSCTTLKRYNSIDQSVTDNNLAGIDLFGFRLSESKPESGNKTLWDLSADAQSQFIKILNTRYPDNEEFLEAMSFEYLREDTQVLPENFVSKDLRMIFSISKKRDYGNKNNPSRIELSPADRIEYLKITLSIPDDSGVRFTGWNIFTTEYGSVDIADVSFSRSLEIDASGLLSANNKGSGGELTAGGKSTATKREDQEIKYRYLKLNGRINNYEIEMEEEGTREIDLTGNVMADISLQFDKFPEMITDFIGLKDSTGRYNISDKIVIQQSEAVIPRMENVKDTVYADLVMDYVFRNVVRGQKTFPEWDDRVKYYKGSVSKKIPLFTSGDYVPDFYCIETDQDPGVRNTIKMTAPFRKEYSLIFRTYKDAYAFCEWLADYFSKSENRNKTAIIGGYILKSGNDDLTYELFGKFQGLSAIPYYR
jgi:hypothetical protein